MKQNSVTDGFEKFRKKNTYSMTWKPLSLGRNSAKPPALLSKPQRSGSPSHRYRG